MLFYSWNVNGIRSFLKKEIAPNTSFNNWINNSKADIVCLQETKATKSQVPVEYRNILGYKSYFDAAERKG